MYLTAFPLICLCYSTCFFKDNSKEMNKFRKVYFSSCIWMCEVGTHSCHVFFIKSTANVVLCKEYIFYYVKLGNGILLFTHPLSIHLLMVMHNCIEIIFNLFLDKCIFSKYRKHVKYRTHFKHKKLNAFMFRTQN